MKRRVLGIHLTARTMLTLLQATRIGKEARYSVCETELLSPAEKEEWISSYLNCQQHSGYNTVPQAFTLSHSLTHSLAYPHNHSPILSPPNPPTHPHTHTHVDIQDIINPRKYIRHGCLSEIINKTRQHNPY